MTQPKVMEVLADAWPHSMTRKQIVKRTNLSYRWVGEELSKLYARHLVLRGKGGVWSATWESGADYSKEYLSRADYFQRHRAAPPPDKPRPGQPDPLGFLRFVKKQGSLSYQKAP